MEHEDFVPMARIPVLADLSEKGREALLERFNTTFKNCYGDEPVTSPGAVVLEADGTLGMILPPAEKAAMHCSPRAIWRVFSDLLEDITEGKVTLPASPKKMHTLATWVESTGRQQFEKDIMNTMMPDIEELQSLVRMGAAHLLEMQELGKEPQHYKRIQAPRGLQEWVQIKINGMDARMRGDTGEFILEVDANKKYSVKPQTPGKYINDDLKLAPGVRYSHDEGGTRVRIRSKAPSRTRITAIPEQVRKCETERDTRE